MPTLRTLFVCCGALSACATDAPRAHAHTDSASTLRTPSTASNATAPATPTANACGEPVIDGDGIGAIRIGVPADSIKARCNVVRDSVETDGEGMPQRVMAVAFAHDTVRVEIDSARVWRVHVAQRGITTRDSLGVGSPLSRLLVLPGVQGVTGEGGMFLVTPARCGLSFQISEPRALSGTWSSARLRQLPPTTEVTRVLVIGCRAA